MEKDKRKLTNLSLLSTGFKKLMKNKYVFILFFLIITRIFLLGVGEVAYTWIQENPEEINVSYKSISENKFIDMWYRWDSIHYYFLAKKGYKVYGSESSGHFGFFPMLPLILKILSFVTGEYFITGMLLSNFSLYFALIIFYKLIEEYFNTQIAQRVILIVLLFPSTLYLSVLYTESLFLLLLLSGIYAMKKERLWLAGICGGLLSATRTVGIFFFILVSIFYIKYYRKNFKNLSWMWLLLCPLGLTLFTFYLKNLTGNSLSFMTAQEEFGRDISLFSVQKIINVLSQFSNFSLQNFINILFFILAIVSLIWCWFKWEKSFCIFSLFALFAPIMTGTLLAVNRYLLVIFPVYVFLATLGENPHLEKAIIIGSSILASLWVVLFVNWYWIA